MLRACGLSSNRCWASARCRAVSASTAACSCASKRCCASASTRARSASTARRTSSAVWLALALFELGDLVVELGLQAGLGFTELLGEVVLAGGNQLRDQTLNGLVYRRANAVFERHRFSLKAN